MGGGCNPLIPILLQANVVFTLLHAKSINYYARLRQ